MKPSGIGTEPNVLFDVTRQKQTQAWGVLGGQIVVIDPFHQFAVGDAADDDGDASDESLTPKNDHIYSYDTPGYTNNAVQRGGQPPKPYTQLIRRMNFKEYVRVSFDGTRPSGNTNMGSRCSLKQPWHMFMWLVLQDGSRYGEFTTKQNDVDLNHAAMAPPPTP